MTRVPENPVSLSRELGKRLWEAEEVKRNTLLSVVASAHDHPDELRAVLEGLRDGSGGHRDRGRGYGDQVVSAAKVLLEFLDEHPLPPEELRTVFGWTARELLVKEEFGGKPGRSQGGPKQPRADTSPGEGKPEPKTGGKFGLVGKNQDVLARLKDELQDEG